jgi:hypothetical protein
VPVCAGEIIGCTIPNAHLSRTTLSTTKRRRFLTRQLIVGEIRNLHFYPSPLFGARASGDLQSNEAKLVSSNTRGRF